MKRIIKAVTKSPRCPKVLNQIDYIPIREGFMPRGKPQGETCKLMQRMNSAPAVWDRPPMDAQNRSKRAVFKRGTRNNHDAEKMQFFDTPKSTPKIAPGGPFSNGKHTRTTTPKKCNFLELLCFCGLCSCFLEPAAESQSLFGNQLKRGIKGVAQSPRCLKVLNQIDSLEIN